MIYRIDNKNILLTAFLGSSAELLIKKTNDYKTLFLPNDKIADSQKLINVISKEKIKNVISFGQKPNIKNKVHIETTAKDGKYCIDTNFNCGSLKLLLEKNNITSKISHNAGTSYCNELYLNGLKYIFQNNLDIKMVFVHIPFKKNVADFDSFCKCIFDVIEGIVSLS